MVHGSVFFFRKFYPRFNLKPDPKPVTPSSLKQKKNRAGVTGQLTISDLLTARKANNKQFNLSRFPFHSLQHHRAPARKA